MKRFLPISLLLILIVAACSNSAAPTATPLPSRTPIPFYNYVSPTPNAQLATAAATRAAQVDTAQAITQGRGRYEALDCGSCHGENGEGNGDKGGTLVGMTLSEADFITLLRSGGDLGSEHQYATNRLSDRCAQKLYLYLKSLEA